MAVATTLPSAFLAPDTETVSPAASGVRPGVVTVAVAGTVTLTTVPAKFATSTVVPDTDLTVPTTTGACDDAAPEPPAAALVPPPAAGPPNPQAPGEKPPVGKPLGNDEAEPTRQAESSYAVFC